MITQTQMEVIKDALDASISYSEYRSLIDDLLAQGKTTGPNQSEKNVYFTELNVARMNKWDKRYEISEDTLELFRNWNKPELWLVITEAWCGDAAHAVPVFNKLASLTDAIDYRLVLRDENSELMDNFLTNGTRSIPLMIRLDPDTLEVKGTWGSRPSELSELFQQMKEAGEDPHEIKKQNQLWYARNRGKGIEDDIVALMKN